MRKNVLIWLRCSCRVFHANSGGRGSDNQWFILSSRFIANFYKYSVHAYFEILPRDKTYQYCQKIFKRKDIFIVNGKRQKTDPTLAGNKVENVFRFFGGIFRIGKQWRRKLQVGFDLKINESVTGAYPKNTIKEQI